MDDVVERNTYRGCVQRAAAAGDAVHLASTVIVGPESQVCSALPLLGEP